jgi:hypothetical protein
VLLNHKDQDVTAIYARWHMFEEKREAVGDPGGGAAVDAESQSISGLICEVVGPLLSVAALRL